MKGTRIGGAGLCCVWKGSFVAEDLGIGRVLLNLLVSRGGKILFIFDVAGEKANRLCQVRGHALLSNRRTGGRVRHSFLCIPVIKPSLSPQPFTSVNLN